MPARTARIWIFFGIHMLLGIGDDALATVLARVAIGDLFPFGMCCKQAWAATLACRPFAGWLTSGTASLSRAKWAVRSMRARPSRSWCAAAAGNEDASVIMYLRMVGAAWDGDAYLFAAQHGRTHIFELLLEHECPFFSHPLQTEAACKRELLSLAAVCGHLEICRLLVERVGVETEHLALMAIAGKSCELLEWVHSLVPITAADVVQTSTEVLDWLHGRGVEVLDARVMDMAVLDAGEFGCTEMMTWLARRGVPFSEHHVVDLVRSACPAILLVADGLGARWCSASLREAVRRRDRDVLRFLVQHGAPLPATLQGLRAETAVDTLLGSPAKKSLQGK